MADVDLLIEETRRAATNWRSVKAREKQTVESVCGMSADATASLFDQDSDALANLARENVELRAERVALRAEVLRLVDALEYAHSEGFQWPVDPLPFGSLAHDLFIERGNGPKRIAARTALAQASETSNG